MESVRLVSRESWVRIPEVALFFFFFFFFPKIECRKNSLAITAYGAVRIATALIIMR